MGMSWWPCIIPLQAFDLWPMTLSFSPPVDTRLWLNRDYVLPTTLYGDNTSTSHSRTPALNVSTWISHNTRSESHRHSKSHELVVMAISKHNRYRERLKSSAYVLSGFLFTTSLKLGFLPSHLRFWPDTLNIGFPSALGLNLNRNVDRVGPLLKYYIWYSKYTGLSQAMPNADQY